MKNLFLFFLLLSFNLFGQSFQRQDSLTLAVKDKTFWWAGAVNDGHLMPLTKPYQRDFRTHNQWNQVQPLLLSNQGDVIWSDQAFALQFTSNQLTAKAPSTTFQYQKAGKTLREAYEYASKTYFKPSGKLPDSLFFTRPQYNTWIELTYNQNQKDVLNYARQILASGSPAGVLMIDDTWQENYGKWRFNPSRFANPKAMMDTLHQLGFKVMVWVCPFVSADSENYRSLKAKKCFVTDDSGEPAIVRWWNGASALLDLTNPQAVEWFKTQLDFAQRAYQVDGFKFDAGDFPFYEKVHSFKPNASPSDHCESYAKIGLDYPLNEYRATWKMGGQALVQRLCDKNHGFEALGLLIPNMLSEGLLGYPFSCPDMIGGGEWSTLLDKSILDQESIVRSAQCHALMPMMQFSVAPWRVLDQKHQEAVRKAVILREKYKDYILNQAIRAAKTGEPIMKSLEFNYPNQGYAKVVDQFLLGDQLLVAPVLTKGATTRSILIPQGKWKSFDGQLIKGPKTIECRVRLEDLPYFERVE